MVAPNFFVVGAPKCGTTALFQYLCLHPQVFCPDVKEPNYFCEDFPAIRGTVDESEYIGLYSGAMESEIAIGDASVCYMYSDVALQNIYRFNPDAKIIFMLRNPVDMVYSLHSQQLFTLNESVTDFEKAWGYQDARREGKKIPRDCLVPTLLQYEHMGRMSIGIRKALEVFPRSQVKVLFIDDLKQSPQDLYDDVLGFLDLDPMKLPDFPVVNANKTNKSRMIANVTQRGLPPFLRGPAKALKKFLGLGSVSISGKLDALNKTPQERTGLSPEMRLKLGRIFDDEIATLEDLTGKDLQHWRTVNLKQ